MESAHKLVLREMTNNSILGWVYMVLPGTGAVHCASNSYDMQALNMLLNMIAQFNKDKGGGGYFVERVVLTLYLWKVRMARGDQTNSNVVWNKRKAQPNNPNQGYGKTLEAFSDNELLVTLNNWNFQYDKATAIKMLETHINPDLEWLWENKSKVPAGCI